mmetsp:Transcript_41254/g.124756  ORF Transcript_41254/g.124756 Transcript_41254/m.124756 type:complete len:231 (+) Transcript_41254:94-786(+)
MVLYIDQCIVPRHRANKLSFFSFSVIFLPLEKRLERTGSDATATATLERAVWAALDLPPLGFRFFLTSTLVVGARRFFSPLTPSAFRPLPSFFRLLSPFLDFFDARSSSRLRSNSTLMASNTPPANGGANLIISFASNGPYSSCNAGRPISFIARSLRMFGWDSSFSSTDFEQEDVLDFFLSFFRTTRNAGTVPISSSPVMGHVGTYRIAAPPLSPEPPPFGSSIVLLAT